MGDDLISRQAVIDAAHKNYDTILDFKSDGRTVADSFEDIINALPSAQSERKNGRWVPGREIGKEILTDGTIAVVYEDYKCSSCGLTLFRLLHNSDGTPFCKFCPNCGADMRGKEE